MYIFYGIIHRESQRLGNSQFKFTNQNGDPIIKHLIYA